MPVDRALLDASVLVPVSLCDALLRAGDAGLYRPAWSAAILDEVRRALIEDLGIAVRAADRRLAAMRRAFPEASIVGHLDLVPRMTNDPRDRHVLAAAVAGGARIIVTSNLRHFPESALAPHPIVARSPDEFLLELLADAPATMTGIIVAQAAALGRPGADVGTVIGHLARFAPRFARRMREELGS